MSRRRLKLGFDMDGILVDLLGPWCWALNGFHRLDVTPADIQQYDMTRNKKLQSVSKESVLDILRSPDFYRDAPAIDGAIETLTMLSRLGHEIHICTAVPVNWGPDVEADIQRQKRAWLGVRLPFLREENLTFASAREKHQHAFDVFVDDHPGTLRTYREAHPRAFVCGIRYPYNEYVHGNGITLYPDYKDTRRAWMGIGAAIQNLSFAP